MYRKGVNWIKNEPSTHEPYHRSSTTDNLTTSQPTFLLTLPLTTDPQSQFYLWIFQLMFIQLVTPQPIFPQLLFPQLQSNISNLGCVNHKKSLQVCAVMLEWY